MKFQKKICNEIINISLNEIINYFFHKTALEIANETGNDEIINLLENMGELL